MGAHVMAYDEKSKEWRAGQVVGRNSMGRYDVSFENGREAVNLKAIQLKLRDPDSLRSTGSYEVSVGRGNDMNNNTSNIGKSLRNMIFIAVDNKCLLSFESTEPKFKKSDTVEVLRGGGTVYRMAVIVSVNGNGTYDVIFADRAKETNVPEANIQAHTETEAEAELEEASPRSGKEDQTTPRPAERTNKIPQTGPSGKPPSPTKPVAASEPQEADASEPSMPLEEGALVEARYGGGIMWYEGKVRKTRKDGSYDIDYDDGEREVKVKVDFVRARPIRSPVKPNLKLHLGATIIANNHGEGTWFPGHIAKVRVNGTFDVDYDDGEKEFGLSSDLVLLVCPYLSLNVLSETNLDVGAKVVGNYRGKNVWYPGKISAVSADGCTFSVHYDDGTKEDGLDGTRVRRLPVGNGTPTKASETASAAAPESAVESQSAPSAGGTRPANAPAPLKHKLSKKGLHLTEVQVGDIIEARHHQKWIPVRVDAINADGSSFDVTPMVGKNPKLHHNIPANHLRPKAPADESSTSPVASPAKPAAKTATDSAATLTDSSTKSVTSGGQRASRAFTRESGEGFEEEDKEYLITGATVEANYGGKGAWFPAVIKNDYGGVGFHYLVEVRLADGTTNTSKVKRKFLRYNKTPRAPSSSSLTKGMSFSGDLEGEGFIPGALVLANYRGRDKWYKGVIAAECDGGTFNIMYDDGEREHNVPIHRIKLRDPEEESPVHLERKSTAPTNPAPAAPAHSAPAYRAGMTIECNYQGKGRWFSGRIALVNRDLTYDVTYDDGTSEDSVVPERLRLRLDQGAASTAGNAPAATATLEEGSKVEGNYRGKGKWYRGVIDRIRADGTVDIDYDDGEREVRVTADHVRLIGATANAAPAVVTQAPTRTQELTEGAKVEGNYRSKGKWYPARVDRIRPDGTLDLDYDDGEREVRVAKELVRFPNAPVPVAATHMMVEGLKVEGNYRGKGKWYPAQIGRVRPDGTFDLDYDDGEGEARVTADRIRVVAPTPEEQSATGGALKENDRVEANYRNRGKWYPGVIKTVRDDGTFDVKFDDGGFQAHVERDSIRGENGVTARESSASPDAMQVQTQGVAQQKPSKPGSSFTPTKGGRTYRVAMGVEEPTVVTKEHLSSPRVLGSAAGIADSNGATPRSIPVPVVGVEANYRNKGIWLTVKSVTDRGNGKVDVVYSDGGVEEGISADRLRSSPTAAVDAVQKLLQVENVEVNYHGKGVWLPAKMVQKNANGTADVIYEDGEQEQGVEMKLIRSNSTAAEANDTPEEVETFKIGDHVIANYRLAGIFLPGVIEKVRADGTYDVLYDDGELEFRVPSSVIKVNLSPPKQASKPSTAGITLGSADQPARPHSAGSGRSGRGHTHRHHHHEHSHKKDISQSALLEDDDSSMVVTRAELTALKTLLEKKDEDIRALSANLSTPNSRGSSGKNAVRWGDEVDYFGSLEESEPPQSSKSSRDQRALLAAKDTEIATLSSEVQSLEESNATLREGMQKFKSRFAALNQEMDAMKQREEKMVKQMEVQSLQIAKLLLR